MDKIPDKFKINLNQNVWILVISFSGLGFSEYFRLFKLEILSFILSIFALCSISLTLIFYTYNYCKNKTS
jgi:hypothetical protein